MCRLAAYFGPEITLDHFLNEPTHGLVQQSWAPREMREAKLNADGFGFGWVMRDGRRGRYVNPMPIWTDVNLASLGPALSSPLWLGNVRSATYATSVGHANTMPFVDDELIFMHNGFLGRFAEDVRSRMRSRLEPRFESCINGTTDSEYVFALLRQLTAGAAGGLVEAVRELLAILDEDLSGTHALLNLAVTDGSRLVAVRHAVDRSCPTLYVSAAEPRFPGAALLASEPLTDHVSWTPVSEHSMVVVEDGADIRHEAL
jgi:glutamine amidotransferase